MTTRKELIGALRARYGSAAFGDRIKILDEFVALTGYHRKHAIRLLRDDGSTENGLLVIADALGVTRGSFYWHFTDHADLVAALLERWRKREIELGRQLREESTDDAQGDLIHLLEVALAHAGRGGG